MTNNELKHLISERIRQKGPLTFAQFMKMALYHVPGGYYTSRTERIGPHGDFYTSPLAHPAFGALISLQLEQMWTSMDNPNPFYVAETGAGKGIMARDILAYSKHLSEGFTKALRYLTVDRSAAEQTVSESVLSTDLPVRSFSGCILSNEMLDAMPVHRVVQREGELHEIYVSLDGDELIQVIDEPSTPHLQGRFDDLGVKLEDGQEAEINLVLEDWIKDVATALDEGYVISIDYGYPANELYSTKRPNGTLMCHYRHTTSNNPFQRVGQQDITAHVDLTSLSALGAKYSLQTLGVVTQAQFLTNMGLRSFIERLRTLRLSSGDYSANLMGMRNLIDPEGLGRFAVVVQGTGTRTENPYGLSADDHEREDWLDRINRLPVPQLGEEHIDLLRGKYPHLAWTPPE